jgi:hypothetical protein
MGALALLVVILVVSRDVPVNSSTSPVAELGINTSCDVDSDCIDIGGGSCNAGCSWVMNVDSTDIAQDWLSRQDNSIGCYVDCPPYNDPTCERGECTVSERR